MNFFLKKVVIFGLLFFLFDKLYIPLMYIISEKEIDNRLEYLLEGKINKELVVVGSSRGARNIIAEVLQDSTKLSAYNLSYPGSDIIYHEFIIRTLLKFNNKTKVIVLTVDNPQTFVPDSILTFRLDRLYPLVKYDYINQELINKGEKNRLISKLFVSYRISHEKLNINQKKFNSIDTIFENGSMPISFQKKNENWEKRHQQYEYNKNIEVKEKLEAFNNIKSLCSKNNIKLIIVSPPNYGYNDVNFSNRIKLLIDDTKQVSYYSYNKNNPIYYYREYYYDINHLKRNGAEIFTTELADFIKTEIKK